jgi:feruloyl esterase
VESGNSPERIDISAAASGSSPASSRPICMYPTRPTLTGGDPRSAASYVCS